MQTQACGSSTRQHLFRFSPFSHGHWMLLQRDNVPEPNALPKLLSRAPRPVTCTRVALRADFRLS